MHCNEHLIAGLSTAWGCSASGAEKRVAASRKKATQAYTQPEDIPWTAARCNRLLRTVTSRINILQKHCRLGSRSTNGTSGTTQDERIVTNNAARTKSIPSATLDPDWITDVEPKRQVQTYGRRTNPDLQFRRRLNHASIKAQSSFATPFVKRLLEPASAEGSMRKIIDFNGNASLTKAVPKSRQLPVQSATSNEEAQKNLVRAFSSLLVATYDTSEPSRTGTQSLSSMCRQSVPGYIELKASFADPDDQDDEDVGTTLYADLEALGTRDGGGWDGLRQVVRAHAFHYASNAIEAGLISSDRISELVSAVERNGNPREVHQLSTSWFRHAARRTGRVNFSHISLVKFQRFTTDQNATGLYLRTYTDLLASSQGTGAEVLLLGTSNLETLLKALVRGSEQHSAMHYLVAVLAQASESGADTRNTAVAQSLRRLSEILTSLAIIQSYKGRLLEDTGLVDVVNHVAVSSSLDESHGVSNSNPGNPRHTNHHFAMASLILAIAGLTPYDRRVSLDVQKSLQFATSTSRVDRKWRDSLIQFTCSVAARVSRLTELDDAASLALVTRGLTQPSSAIGNSVDTDALHRLEFEISLAFDERNETSARTVMSDQETGLGLAGPAPGFTWEEGLCEWIATTPASSERDQSACALFEELEPNRKAGTAIEDGGDCHSKPRSPEDCKDQTPARTQKQLKPTDISRDVLAGSPVRNQGILADRPPNIVANLDLVPNLKRSRSACQLSKENIKPSKSWPDEDVDELSIMSPVRKRTKVVLHPRRAPLVRVTRAKSVEEWKPNQRASLPARMVDDDGSDDELGL